MQHSLVSSFHFAGYFFCTYFFFFKMRMLPNEHLHILTLRHAPLFHSFSLRHTHTHTHTHTDSILASSLATYPSPGHPHKHLQSSPTGNFNNLSITLPASHNTWIHKEHTASYTSCNTQHVDSQRTQLHTLPVSHNTRLTLHAVSRNTI